MLRPDGPDVPMEPRPATANVVFLIQAPALAAMRSSPALSSEPMDPGADIRIVRVQSLASLSLAISPPDYS